MRMGPLRLAALGAVAAAALAALLLRAGDGAVASASVSPAVRTLSYTLVLHNESGELLENVALSAYAPAYHGARVQVASVAVEPPAAVVQDDAGNRVVRFAVDALYPYDSRVVTVKARVTGSAGRGPGPVAEDLEAQPLVELHDARIRSVAQMVRRETAAKTAEAAYRWVRNHVKDAGYIEQERGALWALLNGRGDCSEYAYLYVALMRANGVAARIVGGFVAPADAVLRPSEFHNWAEIYLDGHWRVVDPQKKNFLRAEADYVPFRYLRNEAVADMQSWRYQVSHEQQLRVTWN